MRKKLFVATLSAILSMGVLGACGVDNNRMNDDDINNFTPVRYDRQDDNDVFDNNNYNRRNFDPLRFENRDNFNNNNGILNNRNNDRYNNNDLNNNRRNVGPGTTGTMRSRNQ